MRRRRGNDNNVIDTGRNPSVDTSFPNCSVTQPRQGEKPAGLVSMQQRSGEMEPDTARLLPRGKK